MMDAYVAVAVAVAVVATAIADGTSCSVFLASTGKNQHGSRACAPIVGSVVVVGPSFSSSRCRFSVVFRRFRHGFFVRCESFYKSE